MTLLLDATFPRTLVQLVERFGAHPVTRIEAWLFEDAPMRRAAEQAASANGAPRGIVTSTLLGLNQAWQGIKNSIPPTALRFGLQAGNLLGGLNLPSKVAQTYRDFRDGRLAEGAANTVNTVSTATAAAGNGRQLASTFKLAAPVGAQAAKFLARANPLSSGVIAASEGAHQLLSGKTTGEKTLGGVKLASGAAILGGVGLAVLAAPAAPFLIAGGALAYAGSQIYENWGAIKSFAGRLFGG